jgi:hypothetical protein
MKALVAILLTLSVLSVSCSLDNGEIMTSEDIELPKELMDLPIGIEVRHSKDKVYAEINTKDPEKRGKYKWHYSTSVKSLNEGLTVVEFGAYVLTNGSWQHNTIYDRPFNKEEFAKWYSCLNGELIKGTEFTDLNNWSKGNNLDGDSAKSLWYFIGENKNGKRFRGTAEITSIHKLEIE